MKNQDWSFPPQLQPQAEQVEFDLRAAFNSLVLLRSEVPSGAFTAGALGTERLGNGVAIQVDQQVLILTMGYLITEASTIWLTLNDGNTIAGHALAYDQVTGFGLVQPLGVLQVPTLPLGSARSIRTGSNVLVIGHGGAAHSVHSQLFAKREFAGYWEYLLDEALLVAPPHPQWGGAALINTEGELIGLGSLLIQEQVSGDNFDANLFVPIDLLKPILKNMLLTGKARRESRPWLGLYTTEQEQQVVIVGTTAQGPAHQAKLRQGDVITRVAGQQVHTLPEFYRILWQQGPAGSTVTLTVQRGKRHRDIAITTAARDDFMLKPSLH